MPGIGPIGSLLYDAYIQTPHRFVKKSQLYRYCQLAVTDRSSDNKPLAYKRLDKAGNSELKAMSYRAFTAAMRIKRTNEVRSFYEASLYRTRNHTRARLNTQRKILSVLHGVWRTGQEYKSELFLGSNQITLISEKISMIVCLCAQSNLSDPGCREKVRLSGSSCPSSGRKLKGLRNPLALIPNMTIALYIEESSYV